MSESTAMSKSAKRRANKKAREAAEADNVAASVPEPAPAPKAKAKAKNVPEPKAEAKATAKAKAAPAAQPAAPPVAAAAAPKAKSKAAPAAQQPVAAPAPKVAAKSKAQAKSSAKAPEPEPKEERVELVQPFEMDDGWGGDWEVSTGISKKQQARKDRLEEEKKLAAAAKSQGSAGNRHIAGFTPAQTIPGMAPASQAAAVSQSVNMTGAAIAAQIKAEAAAAAAAAKAAAEAPKPQLATATVKVPEKQIGIVIGPKGQKIKSIQEKSGCNRIDASGEIFTITGSPETVAIAEQAINDLAKKGYTALLFDDFQENMVMVHPSYLPDIIGKKGATIIAIKDALGVEVDIPKGEPAPGRKVKLTIAGKKENAEKAKEVINDIMMYGHHEITHPGEVHAEMDIPYWNYSYIIGTKGSEMRHIQKTFRVRVMIPREQISLNEHVVVVGDKNDVERAQKYIDKIISNATESQKGRDRSDKAEDFWGEEGEEEEWMKQYMYKRK